MKHPDLQDLLLCYATFSESYEETRNLVEFSIISCVAIPPNPDIPAFGSLLQDQPAMLPRRLQELLQGPSDYAHLGLVYTVAIRPISEAESIPVGSNTLIGFMDPVCAQA